eukprot:TRINITY_DN9104_c2_g1_i1.p1 TRINITY_DN9104_c2_g1~~TRINITY_DN9104_c2_g1_i1.p1  ORF type:complete len:586 (+),score=176.73 TRINITY_DN9104_c2_g1_i1:27-1760(+)
MAGPGFMADLVGATGCDGQGNAFARGMNAMYHGGPQGQVPTAMGPAQTDEIPEELMGGPAAASFHQSSWESEFLDPAMTHSSGFDPMTAEFLQREHAAAVTAAAAPPQDWAAEMEHLHQGQAEGDDWLQQFRDRQQGDEWAEDFNTEDVKTFGIEGEAEIPFEEKQRDSKFFDFLSKVNSGEVQLENKTQEQGWADEFAQQPADDWAQDYAKEFDHMATDGTDWAQEFQAASMGEGGWAAELQQQEEDAVAEAWAKEEGGQLGGRFSQYQFEANNPYLDHPEPYKEGLDLLAAGSLAEAVLAFEAAVQRESDHVEAWQHLGVTQAANEKDVHAVAALLKSRELEPGNPRVLMQLAVSYTNESCYNDAVTSLRDWIRANPRLEPHAAALEAAANVQETDESWASEYFYVQPKEHKSAVQVFEAALAYGPDPDLHIGLGVLYNISHEYDKAVANFKEALKDRAQDHQLWNKLGATLANSNRSSEALGAYNRALDINPGYVRSLYNLGIAYSNLGEHHQAAQAFLRSISMQRGASGGDKPSGTQEMWDTLRMTLSVMQRQDLVALTWKQEVGLFAQEFDV